MELSLTEGSIADSESKWCLKQNVTVVSCAYARTVGDVADVLKYLAVINITFTRASWKYVLVGSIRLRAEDGLSAKV